ncbi:MAG: YCF48-related protein [Acidobacteriota bacterium]
MKLDGTVTQRLRGAAMSTIWKCVPVALVPWLLAVGPAEAERPSVVLSLDAGYTVSSDDRGVRSRTGVNDPTAAEAVGRAAPGANSAWKPIGPYGGSVRAIAVSPVDSNLVLAGTGGFAEYGAVFRSTDGGATWTHALEVSEVVAITIASDETAFVAAQFGDVWRSVNGGRQWTPLGFPDFPRALAVDPVDPNHLLVGGSQNGALWRSTDAGNSWQVISNGTGFAGAVHEIVFDPADSSFIALATSSGRQIWVTSNGGMSWVGRTAGLPSMDFLAMAHDGTRLLVGGTEGLYGSSDGGASWQRLDSGWPERWTESIAVDPGNPQVIVAGSRRFGMHRSVDGGLSWQTRVETTDRLKVNALQFMPGGDGSRLLLGANAFGVYRSFDAGESFERSSRGMTSLKVTSVAMHPQNSDRLAASFESLNEGGVFVSTDGGEQWLLEEDFPPGRASHVAFSPDGTLYAVHGGPTLGAREGVYRRNADGTWTSLGPDQGPFVETEIAMLRFSARDPNLILAVGNDFFPTGWEATIWRSADAGTTWTKVYEGTEEREIVREVEILDDGDISEMAAVFDIPWENAGGGILRSSDAGVSWTLSNVGLPFDFKGRALCRVAGEPKHLFAAHRDGILPPQSGALFESLDGGATWQEVGPTATFMDVACSPENPAEVYGAVASADLAIASSDAGRSFSAIDRGLERAGRGSLSSDGDGVRIFHSRAGPARLLLSSSTGVYVSELVAELFADGFESGDLAAWSSSRP